MPIYNYIAKTKEGEEVTGIMDAASQRDLARLLDQKGYVLISAKEKSKRQGITLSFKRVSLKEKMMAVRNLQVMISAGVSLPKAILVISNQTKSRYFKKVLREIHDRIIKGDPLSSAIQNYPNIFPEIFSSMIKVGEKTGGLADVLGILASHLEKDHRLRSKVKGALMYPAVVVCAMIGIGVIMLITVVPKLNDAFKSLNVDLPTSTKIIMNLGTYMKEYWYLVFVFFLSIITFFILVKRKPKLKEKWDLFLLKLPFVSKLIKKINTTYTARTLSSLISGGVSITETLEIASETVSNTQFKKALQQAARDIKKGKKLSIIISQFPKIYPPIFVQMLEVGEETGKTSEVLSKLAEFFEEEVTNTTQNLASIIEPILLLIIGGVIALFAVSMVKPIYSMMGSM
ncbi:type II secretion system F family protein [bacterium]|nr:type II secretion system F family protein [bacterium]